MSATQAKHSALLYKTTKSGNGTKISDENLHSIKFKYDENEKR